MWNALFSAFRWQLAIENVVQIPSYSAYNVHRKFINWQYRLSDTSQNDSNEYWLETRDLKQKTKYTHTHTKKNDKITQSFVETSFILKVPQVSGVCFLCTRYTHFRSTEWLRNECEEDKEFCWKYKQEWKWWRTRGKNRKPKIWINSQKANGK